MDRRLGMRAQVDLPVVLRVDGFAHECRVIDIAPRGFVVQRTKSLTDHAVRMMVLVEIQIPGSSRHLIHALARTVWTDGAFQAMRYLAGFSDADHLDIAELIDEVHRQGGILH